MGRTATHERGGAGAGARRGNTTEHKKALKLKSSSTVPANPVQPRRAWLRTSSSFKTRATNEELKNLHLLITSSNSFMYILPEHWFAQYLKIVYKLQNGLFPFQPDVIYLVKALDERQEKALFSLHFYIAT